MIKFNVSKLPENLANGVKTLADYFDFAVADDGITVIACEGEELITDFNGEKLNVVYPSEVAFYRAIGNVLQVGEVTRIVEKPRFDMCGAMYDHSRNGVLNMTYTKRFIAHLALLGMNTYLMYMEDVYELEDEPYFGYLRGRYSTAELREIDDFAFALGIEVIPCVQTLAHMNQFLRHSNIDQKYKDIDDILEVGKPEVCDLVERIIRTLKNTFRTNKIHVGMDEAYNVGRGRYLDKNGYQTRKEVLVRHLTLLDELSKKYDVDMMMWDDMFYHYYDADLHDARPERMNVVFWNYYDEVQSWYKGNLEKRMIDDPDVVFAGGAWRWGSDVPCHRKTVITTDCALKACIEMNVRNVFATVWGDDGSEAPAETCMLGVTMFAEYNYQTEYNSAAFEAKLKFITGLSYEEWMLQDYINGFDKNARNENTFAKYAMYSDPLCGMYDAHLREAGEKFDLTCHYATLAEKFEALAAREGKNDYLNEFYAALCRVLELKWNLGNRLIDAYKADDKAELRNIANNVIPELVSRNEAMREVRITVWNYENKLDGFEIIDQRVGALTARLRTTARIVNEYADGKIAAIDCLAEERLMNMAYGGFDAVDRHISYLKISSAGKAWM